MTTAARRRRGATALAGLALLALAGCGLLGDDAEAAGPSGLGTPS
ncbi:MAG TPA: hypothetical protein VK507_10895 [Iamia sp.]|nr:hypothetical protein [Iamia sp.]